MASPSIRTVPVALWVIVFFLLANSVLANTLEDQTGSVRTLCNKYFSDVEKLVGIPRYLLHAISLKETGRWDRKKQASFAWPWTVTSGSWSHHFKSKDGAIHAVKRLRKRNIKNIDVGCMQINLMYHPTAFDSLEQAFDPKSNVKYAARFLKRLHQDKKSWRQAIAHYHSSNSKLGNRYRKKVETLWKLVRRKSAATKRAEVIEAYKKREIARANRKKLREKG